MISQMRTHSLLTPWASQVQLLLLLLLLQELQLLQLLLLS